MAIRLGLHGLAVSEVAIHLGLFLSRQVLGFAQELAEMQDSFGALAILLVAPALVVDVRRVPGLGEEPSQQIHAGLVAAC